MSLVGTVPRSFAAVQRAGIETQETSVIRVTALLTPLIADMAGDTEDAAGSLSSRWALHFGAMVTPGGLRG
jgi:hypothetical protein